MINKRINCPQCRKVVAWQDNLHRPFCSERCRQIDLGQWADESYRIAGPKQAMSDNDNVIQIHHKKHNSERS